MPAYTALSGETFDYYPTEEQAAFLDRLRSEAADPAVSIQQFLALAYGEENPILDRTSVPGRGMVTRAVFDNPVWWVISDLIGSKRVNLGLLDMEQARATYTISVDEAAEQLGVEPSNIREAIASRRLGAHLRNGDWYLRRESLACYKISSRNELKEQLHRT